jgi:hypothetical protein
MASGGGRAMNPLEQLLIYTWIDWAFKKSKRKYPLTIASLKHEPERLFMFHIYKSDFSAIMQGMGFKISQDGYPYCIATKEFRNYVPNTPHPLFDLGPAMEFDASENQNELLEFIKLHIRPARKRLLASVLFKKFKPNITYQELCAFCGAMIKAGYKMNDDMVFCAKYIL